MSPRVLTTAVLILILSSSTWAHAQQNDDVALLRQEVAPNVVLLLDTSGSMIFRLNADEFTTVPNRDNWQFNDRFPIDLTTEGPRGAGRRGRAELVLLRHPETDTRINNTGGVCPDSKSDISYPGEPTRHLPEDRRLRRPLGWREQVPLHERPHRLPVRAAGLGVLCRRGEDLPHAGGLRRKQELQDGLAAELPVLGRAADARGEGHQL